MNVSSNTITYTGNAWNAKSATDLESVGFDIIGTSSAAIAHSMGIEDGEQITFDILISIVKSIASEINIPLSVDIERGYANSIDVLKHNVHRLIDIGCAGINIEDVDLTNPNELATSDSFAEKIYQLKKEFSESIFINGRTDTYLLNVNNKLEETISRINIYQNAGVDGIFIPGLTKEEEIKSVIQHSSVPVNVLSLPELPTIGRLSQLGVKRISFGNFGFEKIYSYHKDMMGRVLISGDMRKLF